ncbi:methylated-DNA [Marssonina coronariae]|uniref:Methylated-DNA--protein-cysteine methyltransferase n=1 Tax=Diplocarpon coronariae TaxID=2795749 RepID=A0A218YY21_9HELO|nr:methylated-DNA [Marssonina coronariae]
MAPPLPALGQLQEDWKQMYQRSLPSAARARSPAQPEWPVQLDHCFARIILDRVVGIDTPWTGKIQSPAYKHMSREQLLGSIELGKQILEGEADLAKLDGESLRVRGKSKGGGKSTSASKPASRIKTTGVRGGTREFGRVKDTMAVEVGGEAKRVNVEDPTGAPILQAAEQNEDLTPYLKKIALSQKTSFQKKVLATLCQVPPGRYTTYGAMARHLSSSARAVGSALRNNPFAPQVPCHRVLASGGGLGGFHGSWGRKGEKGLHDDKKRELLRHEGVKFDGKGRAVDCLATAESAEASDSCRDSAEALRDMFSLHATLLLLVSGRSRRLVGPAIAPPAMDRQRGATFLVRGGCEAGAPHHFHENERAALVTLVLNLAPGHVQAGANSLVLDRDGSWPNAKHPLHRDSAAPCAHEQHICRRGDLRNLAVNFSSTCSRPRTACEPDCPRPGAPVDYHRAPIPIARVKPPRREPPPPKSRTIAVRLVSMALTGYYKTLVRPRTHKPLSMLKYDPVVRKKVLFLEQKRGGRS